MRDIRAERKWLNESIIQRELRLGREMTEKELDSFLAGFWSYEYQKNQSNLYKIKEEVQAIRNNKTKKQPNENW